MNKIIIVEQNFEDVKEMVTKINSNKNFIVTKICQDLRQFCNEKLDDFYLLYLLKHELEFEAEVNILKDLVKSNERLKVIIIVKTTNKYLIERAVKCSFKGVIEREYFIQNATLILESISNYDGFYLSPMATSFLAKKSLDKSSKFPMIYLTRRQRMVAICLHKGLSYVDICEELNVSLNTVRMHVKSLYKKLNVNSKYQLINYLNECEELIDEQSNLKVIKKNIELTSKQRVVVELLKAGYLPANIAKKMNVTLNTIYVHIRSIKKKIQLNSDVINANMETDTTNFNTQNVC